MLNSQKYHSAGEKDNELAATGAENTPAKGKPKNNSSKTGEKTEAKSHGEKSPADESSSSSSSYDLITEMIIQFMIFLFFRKSLTFILTPKDI